VRVCFPACIIFLARSQAWSQLKGILCYLVAQYYSRNGPLILLAN
jgi:hypothetical protein